MTSDGLTALELVRRVALASTRPELQALWRKTRFNPVLSRVVRLRDHELRALGSYTQSACLRYHIVSPRQGGTAPGEWAKKAPRKRQEPRKPPFSIQTLRAAFENSAERQKNEVLELIFKFSGAYNEETRQAVLENISSRAATELVSTR